MKHVVLLGVSGNPIHEGHFGIAKRAYESLKADEVWLLLSRNWQKDPKDYASTEHRMAMGNILAQEFPDLPSLMSDFQDRAGVHDTYSVLNKLKSEHSDTHFTWAMGADSLQNFHTWKNYKDIIETTPIVVIGRPGYEVVAKQSVTAQEFKHLQVQEPSSLKDRFNGWVYIDYSFEKSSSDIRKALAQGQKEFNPEFQKVADYIWQHGLYGTDKFEGKITPIISPQKPNADTHLNL